MVAKRIDRVADVIEAGDWDELGRWLGAARAARLAGPAQAPQDELRTRLIIGVEETTA